MEVEPRHFRRDLDRISSEMPDLSFAYDCQERSMTWKG